MKLNLKDEPREWRKSAWLLAGGVAVISTLLHWRHHLTSPAWIAVLAGALILAGLAAVQPAWFRWYHLLSMRLGFAFSRVLGRLFLGLFFWLILTPAAWLFRRTGKDPLQQKWRSGSPTYWTPAKAPGPLDRLF
ncbi:MAG TPA: hypothetical protein VF607_15875 [Verrucomicrobiae bacterium]